MGVRVVTCGLEIGDWTVTVLEAESKRATRFLVARRLATADENEVSAR